MSVTVTSAHSTIVSRHVPVLISLTFGRKIPHFKEHFLVLLEGIGYSSLVQLKTLFPGNVSDFSLAEMMGFEQAVRQQFNIPESVKIDTSSWYRCCKVHFKRSAARIKKNNSLVPISKKDDFQHYINVLLLDTARTTIERYEDTVQKLRTEFPHIKKWLNWYTEDGKGKFIFPILMTEGGISGHGEDTNAQEGTGRWIKEGFSTDGTKPTLLQALQYLFSVGKVVQDDITVTRRGVATRYRKSSNPIERSADTETKSRRAVTKAKRQKQQATMNDGRAPDTTEALLGSSNKKSKKPGRRPGSLNAAPGASSIIPLTFGIPWCYQIEGKDVRNTCPLDSFLMLVYLMRRFGTLSQLVCQRDPKLTEVLDLIDSGQVNRIGYDFGRHLLLNHLIENFGASELQMSGNQWDLSSDTSIYSSSSNLFQAEMKLVYGECSELGEECPHNSAYEDKPGKLASQPFVVR